MTVEDLKQMFPRQPLSYNPHLKVMKIVDGQESIIIQFCMTFRFSRGLGANDVQVADLTNVAIKHKIFTGSFLE